ncbi:MAG: FAD-dependent monooxygenase [Deltaproteobacteria bacterium]|nr:FAD-dependent monooxygenase [Deltaproteobacteria bacterium]
MALLVSGLYPGDADPGVCVAVRLGVDPTDVVCLTVVRRALDARHRRPRTVLNCKVELGILEEAVLARKIPGVRRFTTRDEARVGGLAPAIVRRSWPASLRPIVVGAGPAGLFAALVLAEAGAEPLLLERGDPVEARRSRVARYWREGVVDPESNVLYGEGGAGTWSDGKLHTRRRDAEVGEVLARLVRCGADPSILEEARPHLGTDRLRGILQSLRNQLLAQGAQIRFRARVDGLLVDAGRCVGVRLATGEEIVRGPVVVATGHSARDAFGWLLRAGLAAEVRPMAVGVRIEHPRVLVDRALHGRHHRDLPAADYRLVCPPREARAAWSFCMCPGGLVVPVSPESGRVVLNGMSLSTRGSRWSNAALVVPVGPEDYPGSDPLAGVRFQDALEQRAWDLGGGGFRAPAQRVSDFLAGRPSRDLPRTSHPRGATPVDLHDLLPPVVAQSLAQAIRAFCKRIEGFAGPDVVLLAPESRTTSPVRFPRGPDGQAVGLPGVWPAGEGTGHAGGIVSAAIDGLRAARAIDRWVRISAP